MPALSASDWLAFDGTVVGFGSSAISITQSSSGD